MANEEGSDGLRVPMVFVRHGDPPPSDWMARHPGWVKFPATLVQRGGSPVRANRVDGSGLPSLDPTALAAGMARPASAGAPVSPGRFGRRPGSRPPAHPQGARELARSATWGGEDPIKAYLRAKAVMDQVVAPVGTGPGIGAAAQVRLEDAGRVADPAELLGLQDRLGTDMTLGQVRASIANSDQTASDISAVYEQVLGRNPNQDEIFNQITAIENGSSLDQLRDALVNASNLQLTTLSPVATSAQSEYQVAGPPPLPNPATAAEVNLLHRLMEVAAEVSMNYMNSTVGVKNMTPTQLGTRLHAEFAKAVKEMHLPGVSVEQSFSRGKPTNYGDAGSIRTDVILSEKGKITAIYDYKTSFYPNDYMAPKRVKEIQKNVLGSSSTSPVNVHVIAIPSLYAPK